MATRAPLVAVVLAVAVVVGAVPAIALATVPPADAGSGAASQGTTEAAANESLAPGERLSGVVGVQRAEIEGEMTARAFDQRLARATSNASVAGLVGATIDDLSERLDELAAEKRELRAAYENGSLTTGQYRSQLAKLHVRERALERAVNRTGDVAGGLPAETLEANGVDASAIERLRTGARNLTGPEVADIARSIAGDDAGNGMGPPEQVGPPDFAENRTGGPGEGGGEPPSDAGARDSETGTSDDDDRGTPDDDDRGTPDDDDLGTTDDDDRGDSDDDDRGTPDDDDRDESDDDTDE